MTDLWSLAVRSIEDRVKPNQRDLWLRPIKCVSMDDGRIRLRAPNRYHKEWFEDHFLPSILRDLQDRTKTTFAVDFETPEDCAMSSNPQDPPDSAAIDPELRSPSPAPKGLDDRYSFDKFVVGTTNQFAYAAAQQVATAPASKWNPLFIYGGVGLGKTHLLHAIGYELHRQHPDWNITVVTCEQFVSQFIGSIMDQKRKGGASLMEQFRFRFREEPDVLLVDDIQFLSNKDSSQDEFFHTFNALHHAHKQIVLTSDRLPAELPGLEDRLTSRFTWGLITEIGHPDLETRVAILKRKAEVERMELSDEVALTIAAHVRSNVRALEGALLQLSARSSLGRCAISKDFAVEVLQKLVASCPPGFSMEAIQQEVCTYFGVKLHDLKGQKRHRAIAHPRMVAMYLARKLTSMSFPEIGSRFGGKDHSTVMSAVRKIETQAAEDQALRSVLTTLEGHLRRH